jgi:hypothetical protein
MASQAPFDDGGERLRESVLAASPEWSVAETPFRPYPADAPADGMVARWRPKGRRRRRAAAGADELAMDAVGQVDWRTAASLFPARDQLNCNTCTAFALCGVVADLMRIGNLAGAQPLSPGHLHWCLAGLTCPGALDPGRAASLLRQNAVAAARPGDYPFDPQGCGAAAGVARIRRADGLYTASDAKQALQAGPILAVMDLYDDFWRLYAGGIYRPTGGNPNAHTIEVVGYDDAQQAWLVKNSHGTAWGEHGGYARIAYGTCGLFTADGHGGYQILI